MASCHAILYYTILYALRTNFSEIFTVMNAVPEGRKWTETPKGCHHTWRKPTRISGSSGHQEKQIILEVDPEKNYRTPMEPSNCWKKDHGFPQVSLKPIQ